MARFPHFHMSKLNKPFVRSNVVGSSGQIDELCPGNETLCVKGNYVGGSEGEMIWKLINNTDSVQYVGLVRGATVEGVKVPEYLFGRAFGDVYYLLGMSEFIYDPNDVPLYSLAVYNGNTIGFVFRLPPKSVTQVPEYGFVNMTSYEARLVHVKLSDPKIWAIAYSPSEYLQYYSEIGEYLGVLPPAYIVKSIEVNAEDIGYSFHERITMEVPYQWVEEGTKIGEAIEGFLNKLRGIFK